MKSSKSNSGKSFPNHPRPTSYSADKTSRREHEQPSPLEESSQSPQAEVEDNLPQPIAQGLKSGEVGQRQTLDLNAILDRLERSVDGIVVKLQKRREEKTPWQKFVQVAKDLGPVFTSLAAIMVTIIVANYTYQFNKRQHAVTQGDLKRGWLADFTDNDDAKRKLGAIKLAAYGDEALPAVKDALGVTNDLIRTGGVLTALTMYQSQPKSRSELLKSMLESFKDGNPTLRLGVLEFYIEASDQLKSEEKEDFLKHLTDRLGPHAERCANEDEDFVLKAATFLTKGPFPEAKALLLDVARTCPHERTNPNYEGARIQAVNMLPLVVEQQSLPKDDRAAIIGELRGLEADASDELKGNIEVAINRIQGVQGP